MRFVARTTQPFASSCIERRLPGVPLSRCFALSPPAGMPTTITEPSGGWLPALLQLADAAFPTGWYAHSFGLEEIVRQGEVRDEATLGAFLRERFIPALGYVELPLVREARSAAAARDRADLMALDRLAGALRLSRELREASLQTGRRRLAILIRLRPTPELELLDQICREDPLAGHHAVVWGASAPPCRHGLPWKPTTTIPFPACARLLPS